VKTAPVFWKGTSLYLLTKAGTFAFSSRRKIIARREGMKVLFVISTDDAETVYNAMRLANVAGKKGDEVSVFMLGKGVLYEKSSSDQFNVIDQVNQFEGDFYV
jgi:uncharacterized protein involved in oxidation of intracellular sulfur